MDLVIYNPTIDIRAKTTTAGKLAGYELRIKTVGGSFLSIQFYGNEQHIREVLGIESDVAEVTSYG